MAETLPIKKAESVFEEMARMRDRIMHRANEIFRQNGSIFGRDVDDWLQAERELVWTPAIEIGEQDDQFRLSLAVPGVDPKAIEIQVTPQDVLVKAEFTHQHKKEQGDVHICEFASGNLFRSVHLPKKINPDRVRAEFKNGLLTIKAPVAEEPQTEKIAVATA